MSDFQIFVRVIGRGSNPPGARTQSPNLPWSNWMKCNVFIITYLSLHSSALLTKIGSVPTIFASEPCRILVFNWIHRAIKYGLFREPPLSIYIREEFDVTEVDVRSHKYGLLHGIFHVQVFRVYRTGNP